SRPGGGRGHRQVQPRAGGRNQGARLRSPTARRAPAALRAARSTRRRFVAWRALDRQHRGAFMFDRLTETARRTLLQARKETTALGGAAIEAEHLLLGLLRADRGSTPRVLATAGLSYTDARARIREHWGTQEHVPESVEVPFSDQCKRILEYAT